tara:strand:+ start:104 stop:250 length:147 start_codon:yes stop_codon:yes gene_type:complete
MNLNDNQWRNELDGIVRQLKAKPQFKYVPSAEVLRTFREGRAKKGWKP